MVDLRRTPSVQHAVALIGESVPATLLNMQRLDAARINISLNPGRRLFKPLMEGLPLEWAVRQCELEHEKNVKPNVGLVEAFAPYAAGKAVPWFRECEQQFFPIGAGVVMPVRPSGFWAQDGKLRVLWVQSWKGHTLDPWQKAIFNTILRQNVFVGDFKDAALEWLDLREPRSGAGRGIEVLTGDKLGTVSNAELAEALQILLMAFQLYREEKDRRSAEERATARARPKAPLPLFGDDPDITT